MLQYKVVDQPTLDLLIKINNCALFQNYRLVGGTALALIHGHRKSIDLDFFGNEKIDTFEMISFFNSIGIVNDVKSSKRIDSLFLNNIKVDIVHYPYLWIDKPLVEDDLRLATSKEIAAMKIAAITNRGSKKDFFDLNKLLQLFTLKQILGFYIEKFKDSSIFFALKSLIYFNDAEEQESPLMFDDITWDQVKKNIVEANSDYLKG